MRALLTALTVTLLLLAPAAARAMPHARTCGGYITTADGAPAGVKIRRGRTTCATAKQLLRRYLNASAPCEGSACRRELSGWTCLAASPAVYPRLASCTRGRRSIAAYAIAD